MVYYIGNSINFKYETSFIPTLTFSISMISTSINNNNQGPKKIQYIAQKWLFSTL